LRGEALQQAGQPDKALADFTSALALAPDLPDAVTGKGAAQMALAQGAKPAEKLLANLMTGCAGGEAEGQPATCTLPPDGPPPPAAASPPGGQRAGGRGCARRRPRASFRSMTGSSIAKAWARAPPAPPTNRN